MNWVSTLVIATAPILYSGPADSASEEAGTAPNTVQRTAMPINVLIDARKPAVAAVIGEPRSVMFSNQPLELLLSGVQASGKCRDADDILING